MIVRGQRVLGPDGVKPASVHVRDGKITEYHPPGGVGIRVDSGVYGGWRVPPNYDSLVAKLIVHGRDRAEAIQRMRRALDMFVIEGIQTSIPLHQQIMADEEFQRAEIDTHYIQRFLERQKDAG
jgi:acetyl-CoA carboxylase biotin carboxylase subunit